MTVKIKNAFVTDSTDFQRSAQVHHQAIDNHRLAKEVSAPLEGYIIKHKKKTTPGVETFMDTVAMMIEEDDAKRKFASIIGHMVTNYRTHATW